MNRYIRKRFLAGLLVVLAVLTAAYVTVRVLIDPEAIRVKAVAVLSKVLGSEVSIERATFDPVLGLQIREVSICTTGEDGQKKVLARIPQVRLRHEITSLFRANLVYTQVDVRDAQIYVERSTDGRWNIEPVLAALRERPPCQEAFPVIRVDRAQVHYADYAVTDDDGRPLKTDLQNVGASIEMVCPGSRVYRANLTVTDPEFGRWSIREARFDAEAQTVSFKTKGSPIALDGRFRERLAGRAREIWDHFSPSGGTVRLSGRFVYDGTAERPVDFTVQADVEGASASYWKFPYEITDLEGTLVLRPEGVELRELRGRSGSTPVVFSGTVGGYSQDQSLALRIETRGVPLDAKLRAAFDESRRKVWDDLSPSGAADVVCRLDRAPGLDTSTRIRVLAADIPSAPVCVSYRDFPYPLRLEGRVFYDAGVVRIVTVGRAPCGPEQPASSRTSIPSGVEGLDDLTDGVLLARHDDTVIEVTGGIRQGEPYQLTDLWFKLREGIRLPLDGPLKAAICPTMRRVWEYLDLEGSTCLTCHVERTDPDEREADVKVELTDIRSRIRCRDFPYEIRDPEGTVVYERRAKEFPLGRLLVQGLRARRDDTDVEIDGEIAGFCEDPPGRVEWMDLVIRGRNVPLNEHVRACLPERYVRVWEYLSPTPESRVDVECRLRRLRPDMDRPDFTLQIDSIDSSLMAADFPYRVEHLQGKAEYECSDRHPDGLLLLRELVCTKGPDAEMTVTGVFEGFSGGEGIDRVHLVVEGKMVALDDKLRQAMAREHCRMLDVFDPEGVVDVVCQLKRNSRNERLSTSLTVTPLGATICYRRLPVRLTEVAGRIRITDGVVTVSKVRGRGAGGVVTVDGVLTDAAGESGPDFTIRGTGIRLDGELKDVLPARYRRLWEKLDPRGRVSFKGDVRCVTDDAGKKSVTYSGEVFPDETSLKLGLPVSDLTGAIKLKGSWTGSAHDFRGRAELTDVTVGRTRLRNVTASFEKHDNLFNIYELRGDLDGGEVSAQLAMDLDDPVSFGVIADVRSLELDDVLHRVLRVPSGSFAGLLSGRIMMQGQGTKASDLVGQAELKVTKGRLWEVPFVLSLLKVLNLSRPERSAFTDADLKVDFYDRRVHVKRLNLIGNVISIYGEGKVEKSGEVDLSFSTGWGRVRLPDLPVISPIVRGLQKQLILVKMTGTLNNPKIEILPIAPITAPVKGFVDTMATSD